MCDYSLHIFPNRLATDGEDLVVHRFTAGSLGLASPADLIPAVSASSSASFWSWSSRIKHWFLGQDLARENRVPAVCVPPGARLMLRDIPKSLQRELCVGETEEVEFVEATAEVNTYRDAVRFHNGRQILLQGLREGQRVRVLSTSSSELEPVELSWTTRKLDHIVTLSTAGRRAKVQIHGIAADTHLHDVENIDLDRALRYRDVNIVVVHGKSQLYGFLYYLCANSVFRALGGCGVVRQIVNVALQFPVGSVRRNQKHCQNDQDQ